MKRNLILFIAIFIITLFTTDINAQLNEDAPLDLKRQTADMYRQGIMLGIDNYKAFELYKECSEVGDQVSMNRLGLMYINGLGVQTNPREAIKWFTKSGESGNPKAYYNLGIMYKSGDGVPINYSKAFDYFIKSAEMGYASGMYSVGYHLLRGLGVEQNYEEAIEWYQKGAGHRSSGALFELAICYRNGYGVEKDEDLAQTFLNKAIEMGSKLALWESQISSPEISKHETLGKQLEGRLGFLPETFENVEFSQSDIIKKGNYNGVKIKYDWSGQFIESITEVEILIDKINSGIVSGKWKENDRSSVFAGTNNEEGLSLNGLGFMDTSRYGEDIYWKYENVKFELQTYNDQEYIFSSLDQLSPETLERNKPTQLVLRFTPDDLKVPENENSAHINVYPNPTSGEFNIAYYVKEQSEVNVSIHSLDGRLIDEYQLGNKEEGIHRYRFENKLKQGTYILNISQGGRKDSRLIIKN